MEGEGEEAHLDVGDRGEVDVEEEGGSVGALEEALEEEGVHREEATAVVVGAALDQEVGAVDTADGDHKRAMAHYSFLYCVILSFNVRYCTCVASATE